MQLKDPVNHIHFQCIESTNTWAKNHIDFLDPDQLTCITASEQTHGRGRFERKWVSPKGVNLYATYYFCIPHKAPYLFNISQLLSISCSKILEDLRFSPEIKWPNDLLLEGKKVAGILCETVSSPAFLSIILGIGLNINMSEEASKTIDQPATSLKQISHKQWSIEEILQKLTSQFLEDLHLLQNKGFQTFRPYYEKHLAFKGQSIKLQDGNRTLSGICEGVSKNGSLVILSPDGERVEICAGTILCSES